MKVKGLMTSAALLAALGGAVWWSNKDEEAKKGQPAKDAPPKILTVADAEVAELRFQHKGGESTIVKRGKDGRWEITAPKPLPADQSAVGAILGALAPFSSDKLVEEKTDNPANFGLAQPAAEITVVKKDGKTINILFGDDTAIGSSTYVKIGAEPRIYTIASKAAIDKDWKDLRDKRLLTFDSGKLSRLEILNGKETVEFGKSGADSWTILKPSTMRGDNFAVEELVRKLNEAKMEDAPDDAAAADAIRKFYGSALVGKARTADSSGTQELEVRKGKDGAYYAKSSAVAGVYKVANELGEAVAKGLDDYRNKKVFDFGFQEPTRLEVKGSARAWVFEKTKNEWKLDGKVMQADQLQALIDKLRDLSAVKFKTAGGGNPHSEFTVTTQDGKTVEKVIVTKSGDSLLATRAGETAVYELDGLKVEEILNAASAVKDASAAKPAAKK